MKIMAWIIQVLKDTDETFLWEMLYQALYLPEGQAALSREVVYSPELARYVQGWGRDSDDGFMAIDPLTEKAVGAVWLRLLIGENKGYGYVNDKTPELGIAIFPEYRGQGIGTQLLTHLLESSCGRSSISLSVSVNNPAVRLYERFGFEVVSRSGESLLMKWKGQTLKKPIGAGC
jgi:ribosomal protein S18 acetylase RimI-like enzyme